MLNDFGKVIADKKLLAQLSDFYTGIEVEMDRVDQNGRLSTDPYPKELGNQATNPWITNDYLESMSEVVTPPAKNALDALQYLYGINGVLRNALNHEQYLWPLSMPPILPKHKTKAILAKAGGEKEKYLKQIFDRRGLSVGTPNGVHVNMSVKDDVLNPLYHNLKDQYPNKAKLKDRLYIIVAQGFMRYRWLLTYLFGASPLAEKNYFESNHQPGHYVRSLRQSSTYGFVDPVAGDYSSVSNYAKRILDSVADHKLLRDAEFHGAVRLKGDSDLHQLPKNGVHYIELRMLDLDPSSLVGVRNDTLLFFRFLMTYFIMNQPLKTSSVNDVLAEADKRNEEVTLESPLSKCKYYEEGLQFIKQLRTFASKFQVGPDLKEMLSDMEFRLNHPRMTPSGRLLDHIRNHSLLDYGMMRAKEYQKYALESNYKYQGFKDKHGLVSEDELKKHLFNGSWDFES
ncbi:glutamate--cysteine ligase [Philodulcilactobacillus myokoensis]|uniref:Glutamate--cysteine ligase n=1 Tax=Philodulcilactobacillus myokoensis TaxID=2929573 RepID=A0A9W6B526_9LACO|nr:glutamate--cysteine ligase [Philodulcilactobacillus myokoensis]GLB47594.1 glutamate--cysteine ligase [Philodulcilactobacillus myokoensis]